MQKRQTDSTCKEVWFLRISVSMATGKKSTQMISLLRQKFSSSKCKTLLQLTSHRLKALRSRRAVNVKKVRADVARLLEKGQDSDAKKLVEVVFREQNILAVYELIDQSCQLLISRLESIKSQKECPSDLKEAVTSLLFAAPRCAELVELQQVSELFTLKYGKEFSAAAKEPRPDCGVNKQVIQTLSTCSPDFNEKLRLLKEIAVENNIKWDDETISADNHRGTDLLDGQDRSVNVAELSEASSLAVPDSSRSMRRNEVKEQYQPSPTITSTEAFCVESAQKLPDGAINSSLLDPYARARSQGKMDYKVVSDYMKRLQSSAAHLTSMHMKQERKNSFPEGESAAQVAEREQGYHNASPDGSSRPQRFEGGKDEKRRDVMDLDRRSRQDQLSQLADIMEQASVAAANFAEAARVSADFVRMNSSERTRVSKGVYTNKVQAVKSESSSGPVRNENQKLCMDSTVDGSEDSFKYVVFEQISAKQRETKHSLKVEESNTNAEFRAFPTPYAHKNSDRVILDAEHDGLGSDRIIFDTYKDGLGSEDMSINAFFEGSCDDTKKGWDLHKTVSSRKSQERYSQHAGVQQDKLVHLGSSAKETPPITEKRSGNHDLEAKVADSRPVDPDTPRRPQISADYAADSSNINPVSCTNGFDRLDAEQKLKWLSHVIEEWDAGVNHANMGPPSASSTRFSGNNGIGSPSSQVVRKQGRLS